MHTRDVSDNQISPDSTTDALATFDFDRLYPLAGPIALAGAEPGDTLATEILDLHTHGWGWSAIIPDLGLLAEDFAEPYVRVFDLTLGDVTYFRDDIAIPIEPFLGTMGVCPAGASKQAVMPPGRFWREPRRAPTHAGHRPLPACPRWRAAFSAVATHTPRRATAKCA